MVVDGCVKHKPAYEMRISEWSSDVCSSDLVIPELGGDEQVFAFDAGLGDATADAYFVSIDGCGVDGSVADVQRCLDNRCGDVVLDLPYAQAYSRRAAAIVKRNVFLVDRHCVPSIRHCVR